MLQYFGKGESDAGSADNSADNSADKKTSQDKAGYAPGAANPASPEPLVRPGENLSGPDAQVLRVKPFHPPGKITGRSFSGYTPEQEAKWQILADIAYAAGYGFSQTRLPTPGATLPAEVVEERMGQFAQGWAYEAKREKGTGGLDPRQELSSTAQQYLAERLTPFPQTERPWEPRITRA